MIEMIAGTFGLPVNGIIKGMTKDSGPFEASAEQEARLVKLGLAKYVHQTEPFDEETEQDDDTAEVFDDGDPVGFDEIPADLIPEGVELVELSELSAKELREFGKEYGLTFKGNASKADMIQAIQEAQAAEAAEIADDDDPAPDFDASEAVL